MTRITLVKPKRLTDAHILAEHRELPRIFPLAAKATERGDVAGPDRYTLGEGHMRFFYARTGWLVARHRALTAECMRRGFRVQQGDLVAWPGCVAWEPTEADLQVNLGRLREKLAAPPRAGFYRHCGAIVAADWYG